MRVCVCVHLSVAPGKEFTGLLEKQEGMSCTGLGRVAEEEEEEEEEEGGGKKVRNGPRVT